MKDLIEILEFIKSLGGGGIFGSGLLAIIYLLWPNLFPSSVSLNTILLIGALIGTGSSRLINSVAVVVAKKRADELEDSRKDKQLVKKLQVLKDCELYGYISPSKASEIREELLTRYLLDKPESELILNRDRENSNRRKIEGNNEDESID
jgi:hypothetical protein